MHDCDTMIEVMEGIAMFVVLVSDLLDELAKLRHRDFIFLKVVSLLEDRPYDSHFLSLISLENIELKQIQLGIFFLF